MTALNASRPDRICPNCWATFRAAKPQPAAAWCWHTRTLAYPTLTGWQLEHPSDSALKRLRAGGML